MRHTRILTGLTLALALALAVALTPAAADENERDSAAEQAFAAGYWAETSEGALDEAARHYHVASVAEGPEEVRARALYRLGVVLERMGRTEEAIRALERLAKAHPAARELLTKARARLAEWTAVDLRDGFDEWYRRYQYSPEFQARIVEHVLALGVSSDAATVGYHQLLTIGAPAIPALKAHLDAPNDRLRGHVVDLLLRIGEIPPARHLVETFKWTQESDNWTRLLELPTEQRAALRADIVGDDGLAQTLRLALDSKRHSAEALFLCSGRELLYAVLAQPLDDALTAELLELVLRFDASRESTAEFLAQALFKRGLVPDEVAFEWLREGYHRLPKNVATRIERGELVADGAWSAVLDRMEAASPSDQLLQARLFRALLAALASTDPERVDWDRVVDDVARVVAGYGIPSPGPGMDWPRTNPAVVRRILIGLVERARDPVVAGNAMNGWLEVARNEPEAIPTLLRWAMNPASDVTFRKQAAGAIGQFATADNLDDVLSALQLLPSSHLRNLLHTLRKNRAVTTQPWTDAQLLLFLEFAIKRGSPHWKEIQILFESLLTSRQRLEQMVGIGLKHPEAIWERTFTGLDHEAKEAVAELATAGLPQAWPNWTSEQRLAALRRFSPIWRERGNEALAPFFREQLHAEGTSRPVRQRLARLLSELDLDDVRAAYDLEDPAEAIEAALRLHGRYPITRESYDAFAAARRAPKVYERVDFWQHWWVDGQPELCRTAARDLLADPDADLRVVALEQLAAARTRADMPYFTKALQDEAPIVRRAAATHLARQWDEEALQALVKALDDEDPSVRDKVLETLEAIRKIEEQKAFWREEIRHGQR